MTGANAGASGALRVAYLAHGVAGSNTGVHAKVLAQTRTWAELDPDVEVGVFIRCEAGSEDDWRNQPQVVAVTSSRYGILGRLLARERLSLAVARWRPDVIYLRQSTVSPSVVALMRRTPTVVELNTLDLRELRMRSPLRYVYALASRDRMLRRAVGLVAVTREIASHSTVARLGLPVLVVPNGADLTRITPLPAPRNPAPRLVFLGTPGNPWHGVDKIVRLALLFPGWTFDVVGPGADDIPDPPANLNVHGAMRRDDLASVAGFADVAIGPLAFHRIGLHEASPLKVADYLAYGLPTIIAYTDTRFPDGAPFILQLPDAEDNVERSATEIEAFVAAWRGRRVDRNALAGIDVRALEENRLSFIRHAAAPAARPEPRPAAG